MVDGQEFTCFANYDSYIFWNVAADDCSIRSYQKCTQHFETAQLAVTLWFLVTGDSYSSSLVYFHKKFSNPEVASFYHWNICRSDARYTHVCVFVHSWTGFSMQNSLLPCCAESFLILPNSDASALRVSSVVLSWYFYERVLISP